MVFYGLKAGHHNVRLRDQAECELQRVVYLPDPPTFEMEVLQDTTLLLGETFHLQAASTLPISAYTWSPPTGLKLHGLSNTDRLSDVNHGV